MPQDLLDEAIALAFAEKDVTTAEVDKLPKCDFCDRTAAYDGEQRKVPGGQWAFMCQAHFALHGVGLGLAKGQRLFVRKEEEKV